jgi:hypothetical protein
MKCEKEHNDNFQNNISKLNNVYKMNMQNYKKKLDSKWEFYYNKFSNDYEQKMATCNNRKFDVLSHPGGQQQGRSGGQGGQQQGGQSRCLKKIDYGRNDDNKVCYNNYCGCCGCKKHQNCYVPNICTSKPTAECGFKDPGGYCNIKNGKFVLSKIRGDTIKQNFTMHNDCPNKNKYKCETGYGNDKVVPACFINGKNYCGNHRCIMGDNPGFCVCPEEYSYKIGPGGKCVRK